MARLKNQIMKVLILLLLVPLLAISQLKGKVVKIKDGDTVVVLDSTNTMHTIRVADIDCPEYAQPFSQVAKQFTSDEIYLQQVEVKSKGKDRYGRTIGFIIYGDQKNLSEELLKNGLAWHYKHFSKDEHLANLESKAKRLELGLWKDKTPIPPWEWRRQN